ncbi:SDR family NAD(P)-dependent oxidoreductase [Ktedonosporobacter rubrisoli]|uniref:SDR family NAD(P)-dependent oxidoreductase n=1 Tax=Ktedonosporobacter rubrisoli TaxID=2509675 RepID=A0A4P6JI38_KTERU|nr:SDR family NAD(P)-dependent oxidoreductase [Ktedonosporobacter rubrisoli]QBD74572.1 SDR family NAD(P)-dependent oxidoreductase [Ktedonosporobacter rubrisoli]
MGKLDGKVAIVTGAGRGLGRAIAQAYLQEGASVTATAAREQAELDQLAKQDCSQQVLALLADVTNPAACEQIVEQTIQRFGHVDILVNNAARGMKYVSPSFLMEPTRFWEIEPAVWQMIIETNVNGTFYMTRAAVRRMLEQQRAGSIINISMNYEGMKRRGFSPYGPSKAALESASAIWAQELTEASIRVNVLLPGSITNTGMVPAEVPADLQARMLQPEIIQAPAVFLASDASQELTGRRLIAAEWSATNPQGRAIVEGIGTPSTLQRN